MGTSELLLAEDNIPVDQALQAGCRVTCVWGGGPVTPAGAFCISDSQLAEHEADPDRGWQPDGTRGGVPPQEVGPRLK